MLILAIFALCFSVAKSDGIPPSQFHISLAGSDDRMSVSWFTDTTSSTYVATCYYGVHSQNYTLKAVGDTRTYFVSYQHDVVLTDLRPGTIYYYKCGDGSSGSSGSSPSMSHEKHFTSASSSITNQTIEALIYGDMGVTNSDGTIAGLKAFQQSHNVSFIAHVGDLSYADDIEWFGPNPKYEQVMDHWFNMIEPLAENTPYQVLPGNHDASCHAIWNEGCDKRLTNFSAYRTRWRMPWRESGTNSSQNMYYSFNYGAAHWVAISTETDYPGAPPMGALDPTPGPFGDQIAWLERDLAHASSPEQRQQRPWIIVMGHRPLYTNAGLGWPVGQELILQSVFEPLFSKYKVDLFISAHEHSYERMYPIYQDKKTADSYHNPPSTVYMVHGCAGNKEDHTKLPNNYNYTAFKNTQDYGFTVFRVNQTALEWDFRSDDKILDSVTITKTDSISSKKYESKH